MGLELGGGLERERGRERLPLREVERRIGAACRAHRHHDPESPQPLPHAALIGQPAPALRKMVNTSV
jgi:hypothetical protein